MRQETKFERKGGRITNLETGKVEDFASKTDKGISKAKRKSRQLQEANGGLGMGYVRKAA